MIVSLGNLSLLLLAGVISLVLVLRHSLEKRSYWLKHTVHTRALEKTHGRKEFPYKVIYAPTQERLSIVRPPLVTTYRTRKISNQVQTK